MPASGVITGKHQTGVDKDSGPFIRNPVFMNQTEQFPTGIFCEHFISKIDGCCRRIQTGKIFRRMISKNDMRKRSIGSKPVQCQIKSRSRIAFRTEQSIHSAQQILADKFRKILFQLIKARVFQIRHFQGENLTGKFPCEKLKPKSLTPRRTPRIGTGNFQTPGIPASFLNQITGGKTSRKFIAHQNIRMPVFPDPTADPDMRDLFKHRLQLLPRSGETINQKTVDFISTAVEFQSACGKGRGKQKQFPFRPERSKKNIHLFKEVPWIERFLKEEESDVSTLLFPSSPSIFRMILQDPADPATGCLTHSLLSVQGARNSGRRNSCQTSDLLDHFFIFQKNSLYLKLANFSSLKRRSIFTSRKILREKLELHSASKKSLNIAKMVEKRFELPVSTHDLAYEKIRLADCLKSLFFLTRAKIPTRA